MNDNLKDGAPKATARRRLIRGAFAAPAALTLCSGSAFAASSNQACVANQVNNPQYPGANPAATWVRVRIWKHTKSGTDTFLVSGTEIEAMRGTAGNTFIKSGQWKKTISPFDEFVPSGSRPSQTTQFVALRMDSNGVIVGISDGNTFSGTSAIAKSCWTSFSGVAFFN